MKKTFFLTIIYLLSTQLFGQKLDSCKFNNVLGENEYTFYKINDKLDLYKLPIREGLYLCALYYKDSAVFETMRVTKYNDDAIGNRFNENEFINYVNHLRDSIGETSLIRSNDSCVSCIEIQLIDLHLSNSNSQFLICRMVLFQFWAEKAH